jgi:hypothetical protein
MAWLRKIPGNWDLASVLACAVFTGLLLLGLLINRG